MKKTTKHQKKAEIDLVKNPAHYHTRNESGNSPAEYCKKIMSTDEYKGWCKIKIIHYITRAGKKEYPNISNMATCEKIDLEKARWCLDELLSMYDNN